MPTNVSATPSTTSAAITWSSTGATAYELQYKLSSATTWTTVTSSTNSFSLANLTCASAYDVKVKSICSNASSAYSGITSFTTTTCTSGGGGGTGGGGTSSCSAPSTFFFDPQTYIPLGEIKVGQGRVYPVWAVSVDAYIPTNRLNWAISNVHAAHLFRNIAKTDKIPADFYFATSFKESFCGCDAGMQAAPPNSAYPFTYQPSSLLDGCFQIENNSAYNELINLYPQRFPVGQHPNLIGNHNYETAALSKAYYDIFAVKFWEIHKGWNPKDFFNNATDVNAAIKLMAIAYNRGLWYTGLQTVLQTDRTNAITATTISPYFADNSYGYDYQNALTQYVQVLGNQANLLPATLAATNPATNLPYNYFGSYYDPQVSWAQMNSYIDSISVMYPQLDIAAAKSAIQTVFNGINSGNPISFRYQLGTVLDKLILVFPADDPTTNIATIYGCAVGTTPTNTPPTVTLTSPANNSTFTAPATINLAATATDANGTITKVQFYRGTTLIGEDLTSPYTFTWSSVAAGTYTITAKATDNQGATTTSTAVTIVVNTATNTPPTVTLTSPANNSTFTAPATVNLAATAADANGTVTKVQFYRGTTLIGEDLTSPYTFTWSSVAAGTYTITAKATDNQGATTTSAAVTIVVNAATNTPPTVTLTSPANNSTFTAPATVNLAATAADANGTVTKVQFYRGTTLIGEDLTSPYTFTWSSVAAGTYTITAKATDNQGATTTSAAVTIVVNAATNTPPTVTLTSPANNSTFTAPATVNLAATAADANGTVTNVQFYRGTTLIGEDLTSPYTFTWSNVAVGTYVITAKATDNQGATTTSAAATIVVNTATNTPPTVTLTSPTNNSTFTAPATINLAATAADANGTVTKVQFYRGTTLIGQDLTSPYTFTWSNVAVGTYVITAKATDNQGATTTSAAVTIVVSTATNTPPTVTLTSPINNSTFTAPATINLAATASDANGTVTKVQFYKGTTLIGQDLTPPYTFTWSNVAAGTYAITAKATDNQGATTTSTSATITVNTATSGCTAPIYIAGASYSQNAQVQNVGNQYNCLVPGWCSGSAQYYAPGVGLAWQQAWSLVGPCSNTSGGNILPIVSISSPANNAAYTNPSAISITANATDTDGTITKVAFYNGNTLLGEDLTSPYAYTFTSPAAAVYALKAIATDNSGSTSTSSIVTIVVGNNNTPCSRPAWVSTTAYVANDTISYAGVVYRAKWWTQNQNPATNSGTDGPWASLGNCGSGTGLRPNLSSIPIRAGIYPNPTTEMLNILVEDLPATQAAIMVYNVVGQLVISKQYEVEGGRLHTELDLTAVPSGILTLVITASGEQIIRKVIKQ